MKIYVPHFIPRLVTWEQVIN